MGGRGGWMSHLCPAHIARGAGLMAVFFLLLLWLLLWAVNRDRVGASRDRCGAPIGSVPRTPLRPRTPSSLRGRRATTLQVTRRPWSPSRRPTPATPWGRCAGFSAQAFANASALLVVCGGGRYPSAAESLASAVLVSRIRSIRWISAVSWRRRLG